MIIGKNQNVVPPGLSAGRLQIPRVETLSNNVGRCQRHRIFVAVWILDVAHRPQRGRTFSLPEFLFPAGNIRPTPGSGSIIRDLIATNIGTRWVPLYNNGKIMHQRKMSTVPTALYNTAFNPRVETLGYNVGRGECPPYCRPAGTFLQYAYSIRFSIN